MTFLPRPAVPQKQVHQFMEEKNYLHSLIWLAFQLFALWYYSNINPGHVTSSWSHMTPVCFLWHLMSLSPNIARLSVTNEVRAGTSNNITELIFMMDAAGAKRCAFISVSGRQISLTRWLHLHDLKSSPTSLSYLHHLFHASLGGCLDLGMLGHNHFVDRMLFL